MKHHVALLTILIAIGACYFFLISAQNRALSAAPNVELIEVPGHIGGYTQSGQDLDVGEDVRQYLETSRILSRRYSSSSGRPLQLTVVHAAVTRRSLHFPEICLVGSGWDIREQQSCPVGVLFRAKQLLLVRGAEREAVLYWFQTGTHLTGNYFVNAWNWASDQVRFHTPVSAMIRLSTPVGRHGEAAAFSALNDFAIKLAPLMQDCGRRKKV